jgi:hypothetical protein
LRKKNQKELAKAVEKMNKEIETYKKNIHTLNEFSNRFHGLDRAVAIVEGKLD